MNFQKNENKEKVSVIVTNWNGVEWLERCLKSLVAQTYPNFEVIVVDNASTDGSKDKIKKFFPKIKIIENKKNYGFPKAVNIGINNSKGDYIIFMNNDTWVEPDFIERICEFYIGNNYDVVAPLEDRYGKQKDNKYNTTIDLLGSPAYYLPKYKKDKLFYLCGVCIFCTKKTYRDTLGMDGDFFLYFEDADWFWRLSLFGKRFTYIDSVPIYHSGASSSNEGLIKYKTFLLRNKNILQMLLKNYSTPMLIIVLPLYFLQNLLEILFFIVILKPKIVLSYIQGWIFNVKNIRRTLKKREWIQKRRVTSDLAILRKMYLGSGKFLWLTDYFKIKMGLYDMAYGKK